MLELEYFETLSQLEAKLQDNYELLQSLLQILSGIVNSDDEQQILQLLNSLKDSCDKLIESSTDLRYSKFQSHEARLSAIDQLETQNHVLMSDKDILGDDVIEFITVWEEIQQDSLKYLSLLNNLTVELARQVEVENVSKYDMNDWEPSTDLKHLIEQHLVETQANETTGNVDSTVSTKSVDVQLQEYLNNLKLTRAKHALDNKYNLKEQLDSIQKECQYWKQEWDNIESMMFGDSPRSMKTILHKVETMKSRLEK